MSHDQKLEFDANGAPDSVALSEKMLNSRYMVLFIIANSGAHSNHSFKVQISPDGETWMDAGVSIVGVGCKTFTEDAYYVRVVLAVAEGSPSKVDVHLQGK